MAHGVALKPGKPICLAAEEGKPVVILPGFPTSAIFTFHEFVAPVIAALAGRSFEKSATAYARLVVKINSEIGRTEYVLVGREELTAGQERGLFDICAGGLRGGPGKGWGRHGRGGNSGWRGPGRGGGHGGGPGKGGGWGRGHGRDRDQGDKPQGGPD